MASENRETELDDEPLTAADRAAIARGRADAVRYTDNEVRAELGLEPRPLTAPQRNLLRSQLAIGDESAVLRVASIIKRLDGNMRAAAMALGISERALYNWRDSFPALGEAIAGVARGRVGRPPADQVKGGALRVPEAQPAMAAPKKRATA